jgi:tripartite-type tricarboxylate transporter receptor subunit TctC
MSIMGCWYAGAAAISAWMLGASASHAQPAPAHDAFFKGKTINLVVGYTAGGGYDQYGRLLARHLGRHIPGNPNVIVQNMPGAASLTSVRYLALSAPKHSLARFLSRPFCCKKAR